MLDEIADAIIAECDGVHRVTDIVAVLAARYEAQAAEISVDVLDFLEDLVASALVSV